ncbi:MAG TPA: hypothetical protein VH988_26735 [Thermoanaerobaculia bacterium]|nr:hypothetical protein [Thermoanaerobaculia bacterium]
MEEFESMLAERIDTWNQQLREQSLHEGQRQGLEQGLEKGLQQGLQQGLLRGLKARFGTIDAVTQKRIAAADGDLLLHWFDRSARAESLADVFRD